MTKERLALLETEKVYNGNTHAVAQELGDFLVADPHQHSKLHERAKVLLGKISLEFKEFGMASLMAQKQALAMNVANSSFEGGEDLYQSL